MNHPALIFAAALTLAAPALAETKHTVVAGDTLWDLAGRYYQDHSRWKDLYSANRDKIENPGVLQPGQVLEVPQASAVPAAPPPAPPPAPRKPAGSNEEDRTDDFSVSLPPGFAGQYPSLQRRKVAGDWAPDGTVTDSPGRAALAAEGDWVVGKMSRGGVGDLFSVYRRAARRELDEGKNGLYLQFIGRVEARASLGESSLKLYVLKSADSVQEGDWLKKENSP